MLLKRAGDGPAVVRVDHVQVCLLYTSAQDERVTSMIRVPKLDEDGYLVMVTRRGVIKRTPLSAFQTTRKGGVIAIDLDEGDELCWVRLTNGSDDLLVATKKGMAIRFSENDVRAMGRTARGVKALTLKEGDVYKRQARSWRTSWARAPPP